MSKNEFCHRTSSDDGGQLVRSVSHSSGSLRFLRSQSIRDEESNMEIYIEREDNESEELLIQGKALDRFNHRIIVSDVVFKNRWSNVTSSDLIFLNSEMLNGITSNRFSSMDTTCEQSRVIEEDQSINIKDEKRSMSEIIVYSRFNNRNRELSVRDERRRKLWLPIARRTVKWFANRETTENRTQTLNV